MPSASAMIVTAVALRNDVPKDVPLRERLAFAMRAVRTPGNHYSFMCTTDEQMFRGAIGAVLLTCDEDERAQIVDAIWNLRILSAAIEGLPVDLAQLTLDHEPRLRLMELWHEANPERKT